MPGLLSRLMAPRVVDDVDDSRFVWIDDFIRQTKVAVFVRLADQMLLIRPDKTMMLNATGAAILDGLYARDSEGAGPTLRRLSSEMGVGVNRLVDDTDTLLQALSAILRQDFTPRAGLRFDTFDRNVIRYPTIAEIALTYQCNNRCTFCYAAAPYRAAESEPMSTAKVKQVMDRIFHEAHVPSLSFTGGEATLRKDLPELIAYGKVLGFRVNLISNGLKLGKMEFARTLVEAGLDSAQISIEADNAELHDSIVDKRGAWEKTVRAVANLQELGVHVHTNSTICAQNIDHVEDLIRFAAREMKLKTMSMNMLIRTGTALGLPGMEVTYTQVGAILPKLKATADAEGITFVWYSPIPYCIFNPVLHGMGAKSCACVDGLLSVDPNGDVLPCSSFEDGIGSLLEHSYDEIDASEHAQYWRKKKFVPPTCGDCPHVDICGGACPLYWDAAGSFDELPHPDSADPELRREWEERRWSGGSFGVRERDLVQLGKKG